MPIVLTYLLLLILKNRHNFTLKHGAIVFIVLTMMASMFNAMTLYIDLGENFSNLFLAVIYVMFVMGGTILYLIYFAIGRPFTGMTSQVSRLIVGMIVWNEASLGVLAFSLGFGGSPFAGLPSVLGGGSFILYAFSAGVNSFLFVAPMSAEMIIILFLTKAKGLHLYMLLSLLFMALFSPTVLGNSGFVREGTILTAAAMVVFMIALFERISKGRNTLKGSEKSQLILLFFAFSFMAFGIFFGTLIHRPFYIAWLLYAFGMATTMGVYFNSIIRPVEEVSDTKIERGWVKNPLFLFIVLLTSFISEWFLAAAIMTQNAGTPLSQVPAINLGSGLSNFKVFSDSLNGVTTFTPLSSVLNSIYIIGVVADSSWFWSIMGLEMSALVVIRMKGLHWKEKKWNLVFALIAFWAWTVWFQGSWWTTLFGTSAYRLPLWPNMGELGPLYPEFALGIVLSYVVFAVLALLFGRRSYCSTLCPSAVMYGGTLGQSMISYNYASGLSKKHIGSRYKESVLAVAYNSWIIAILFSAFSYYTSAGSTNLTLFGIDTTEFYSLFIWNFLWYAFFISIPFMGMSPCRRYGWCSTGTFVGFFSKIGLFKLKVREPQTCVTCPTKDCVTNCEVGLGDLASQFIKNGYFKSSKCVGAGSCLEACPYDNIYFYDVRNYIKERRKANADGKK